MSNIILIIRDGGWDSEIRGMHCFLNEDDAMTYIKDNIDQYDYWEWIFELYKAKPKINMRPYKDFYYRYPDINPFNGEDTLCVIS